MFLNQECGENKVDEAIGDLNQLAKAQPQGQERERAARQCARPVIQQHYDQGIRLYREEKLPAAINEWRIVLQHAPSHEGAKKNIESAKRLLKGLQERQQKQGR